MELNEIKELLRLVDESGIAVFELEQGGVKLRLRKAVATRGLVVSPAAAGPSPATAFATGPTAAPDAAAPAAPAPGPEGARAEEPGVTIVKSPIVGTFFRAPDPSAPAFVNVGDRVRLGQVLCIIEAMKLMNEIESDVAGEVVKIHRENGQPVQFGDPLFSIRT